MMIRLLVAVVAIFALQVAAHADAPNEPPKGFAALFDGKSLDGWWGWGTKHYKLYAGLDAKALAELQEKSREGVRKHWRVEDGELVNNGKGPYLTTNKFYGDFELLAEYKTVPKADSGIYLRGVPQVQIWDSTDKAKFKFGAEKGSGGLWNNGKGAPGRDPLVHADKPFGQWNQFRIIMRGDHVTVYLNDKLVVDKAKMRNHFERGKPMPATGPIQLQTHGGEIRWRNLFIREIERTESS